jgi:hypothetical protein
LHVLLVDLYKELHGSGIGTVKSQATNITIEQENQLWESGVLGSDNPDLLLNGIFYLNRHNFTLHGGSEHQNLRIS